MSRMVFVWTALAIVVVVPIAGAAASPLLVTRDLIYIAAGFAGVGALVLMLLQPLLAGRHLPGLSARNRRRAHLLGGVVLVVAVLVHVVALWITSPPDVVDILLFGSPTPFSAWGVIAMFAVLALSLMVAPRRRLPVSAATWRGIHVVLATGAVLGGIVHALLIEGTMEPISKVALCALVVAAIAKTIADLRGRAKRT